MNSTSARPAAPKLKKRVSTRRAALAGSVVALLASLLWWAAYPAPHGPQTATSQSTPDGGARHEPPPKLALSGPRSV
ncbi:MAG: hypothetical protein JWN04_5324, partial [Myxococcaceae bacterium]|nr:hypothetical protein [Myxococcaceae bacterium]